MNAGRQKANIVVVGRIDPVTGQPTGWSFDGKGTNVPALNIMRDGSIIYAGYTVDELTVIAAEQKKEM